MDLPRPELPIYTIHVRGRVEHHWEAELRLRITYHRIGEGEFSTLTGQLPDQAALLGVLNWLAMWGYEIVSFTVAPPPGASGGALPEDPLTNP
ncbi:MAG: hypothetical protein SNJ69_08800 [Chloroflexaceae bacterium]